MDCWRAMKCPALLNQLHWNPSMEINLLLGEKICGFMFLISIPAMRLVSYQTFVTSKRKYSNSGPAACLKLLEGCFTSLTCVEWFMLWSFYILVCTITVLWFMYNCCYYLSGWQHATRATMVLYTVYVSPREENHMHPDPRMEPSEYGKLALWPMMNQNLYPRMDQLQRWRLMQKRFLARSKVFILQTRENPKKRKRQWRNNDPNKCALFDWQSVNHIIDKCLIHD